MELPICPACGEELEPGKHHNKCKAGRTTNPPSKRVPKASATGATAAPRATKQRKTTHQPPQQQSQPQSNTCVEQDDEDDAFDYGHLDDDDHCPDGAVPLFASHIVSATTSRALPALHGPVKAECNGYDDHRRYGSPYMVRVAFSPASCMNAVQNTCCTRTLAAVARAFGPPVYKGALRTPDWPRTRVHAFGDLLEGYTVLDFCTVLSVTPVL